MNSRRVEKKGFKVKSARHHLTFSRAWYFFAKKRKQTNAGSGNKHESSYIPNPGAYQHKNAVFTDSDTLRLKLSTLSPPSLRRTISACARRRDPVACEANLMQNK
jgi:hypothetical protein